MVIWYSVLFGVSIFFISAAFIPEFILEKRFMIRNVHRSDHALKDMLLLIGTVGAFFYDVILSKLNIFQKNQYELMNLLEKNGYPSVWSKSILGTQWLLVILLFGLGLYLFQPILMMISFVLSMSVKQHLKRKWKKQQSLMGKHVLSLAELTAIGVSAGLSPIEALQKAIDGRDNHLFEEVQLAIHKIRMGSSADRAFMECSKRIEIQEMHAFLDQLIQAIETGAGGFSESVVELVKYLRELRQARIEEIAGQTEAKLLLPLMLIFGSILSFLLGPLTLTFTDVF
ncbi:type II secretion system F family protein [Chengkuizengella axinellae]|uniref:Type II secretion system F family protein n=1 Tax=Chengkuizengella axinellae TaxID=3064388 RepID=A0ABT9J4M8_9BACL|nr:type II secretion system F family protein [Chengkuizengella sp. 2205SS18-9]MDP5276562.1 type II secretion system F family protein [Chengkuizengella sp. 2205SS18-9]